MDAVAGEGDGDELTVNCIGERFNKAYAEVFTAFMEAAFQTLGYKTVENEASRGIIRLRLTKG